MRASFSIRRRQPGQMKLVGSREEAGMKLSRATGGRMLISALLAKTRDPGGDREGQARIRGRCEESHPRGKEHQGFRPRLQEAADAHGVPKVRRPCLSTVFYQGS